MGRGGGRLGPIDRLRTLIIVKHRSSESYPETSPLDELVELCGTVESLEEIQERAIGLGGRLTRFGFRAIGDDYPFRALDLQLPDAGQVKGRRLLIHETFPAEQQEAAESLLATPEADRSAPYSTPYFPPAIRGKTFSAREMPSMTVPLLDHNMTKPTAQTVSRFFLAPVVRRLFDQHRLVPSELTMSHLVAVEKVWSVRGSDTVELGPRFIPPYIFEAASDDNFMSTVLQNATRYGELVGEYLTQELLER